MHVEVIYNFLVNRSFESWTLIFYKIYKSNIFKYKFGFLYIEVCMIISLIEINTYFAYKINAYEQICINCLQHMSLFLILKLQIKSIKQFESKKYFNAQF